MKKQSKEQSLNELVNVKDIKKHYLYTKDGYVFGYIQIFPFNLDLVPEEEKAAKINAMARSFDGDRKDWVYQSFPREIDLDSYKDFLKQKYQSELENIGKRRLLAEMILEAVELSTSGENYEHQHYLKIWKKLGTNASDSIQRLKERMEEFKARYEMVGIRAEILNYEQIIKLCNLYGNSTMISYEHVSDNSIYTPITQLR